MKGEIKMLSYKGFGFIGTEKDDVFFHASSLKEMEFDNLFVGQKVVFDIMDGKKGLKAKNVAKIDEE